MWEVAYSINVCYWEMKRESNCNKLYFSPIVLSFLPKFYEKMNKRPSQINAQVKVKKFNKRPGRLFESLQYIKICQTPLIVF